MTSCAFLTLFDPKDPKKVVKWRFLGDWTPPGKSADEHDFKFETMDQREFFNSWMGSCYGRTWRFRGRDG